MKMRLRRRGWALAMAVLLLLPVVPFGAAADDPPAPAMIEIESDWKGSVFGDLGGDPTPENFGIRELPDGSVELKSLNNKGKIASNSEGIAYYYKEVPTDADYEISAKAKVEAWTANNQVAFGIMLRNKTAENVNYGASGHELSSYHGNYVAAGAVKQAMKGFHRASGGMTELLFDADAPAVGNEYEIRVKKSGGSYFVTINGQTQAINDYAGEAPAFAGLFTSRNTVVTFSEVTLKLEGEVELGDWSFIAFGSNTSPDRNPAPEQHEDGSVTMLASGGKIASGDEGMSFYYKELPAGLNFELRAKATVIAFNKDPNNPGTPNQKSFGLMLRDEIGKPYNDETFTSNYVMTGALDTVTKAVYKYGGQQTKLPPFEGVNHPTAGEGYELKIQKSGDTYVLSANGQSEIVTLSGLFDTTIYAGLFVARDAHVTFSDFEIIAEKKSVTALTVDYAGMKTEYLVGESLDLTGLIVQATYSDSSSETVALSDVIVTGFDSSVAGNIEIFVHYGGKSAAVPLLIKKLDVTALNIIYYPAKTDYYAGDPFDPSGLVVEADYLNGYLVKVIGEDLYEISIEGHVVTKDNPYVFLASGEVSVTIVSTETPDVSVSFQVTVSEAELVELEIRNLPAKRLYFIGESLDLDGIVVYAKYGDDTAVRLMRHEFTASALDTATPGKRTVTITHKGKSADFEVEVKEREFVGLEVGTYPQTTFALGEPFNADGLVVLKVYDNGDREMFPVADYTVDASAYDNSEVGTYRIRIVPADDGAASISYDVTVRAVEAVEWNTIRFGQSTSNANNKVTVDEENETVLLEALGGSAGKITGDHDGISFYYTVVDAAEDNFELSANIRVIEFAKDPHDGQESFGIMARDAIGPANDSGIFASNIVGVGGYSGGTRNPVGTQLFARTGVESPDGAGSQGIQAKMLKNERPGPGNTHPVKTYRLTLAKTNSGYVGTWDGGAEGSKQEILYLPDILNVQDDKIYVGFYAARLATIEVSDIEFKKTAAATDPPRVEPPAEPVQPEFAILSLDKTPEASYSLVLKSNVDGTIGVKQGTKVLVAEQEVAAGAETVIPATLAEGDNHFSLTFLPDDTQLLTSYDKIVQNFTVTRRAYDGDIYVSPNGVSTAAGTEADPLDLDTAIAFVKPGQTIYMLDGVYERSAPLDIRKYNDGREGEMKKLFAAPGAKPIVDFGKKSEGALLSGNWWHIKGIDFRRSKDNTKGFTIGGSYNIIEECRFYENGDTGLQISRTDITENDKSKWPSYNLILNSVSFDNRDPSENNADGFAAKLTSGEGNVFRGSIAHNNIDDGWDLYTKAGTGAIGAVLIEDSIAYNNGFLTDGTVGKGDKNGFKLGGEGIHVPHVIRNSIAFGNGAYGFTSNSNPGVIAENNIAFNNAGGNLNFTTYTGIEPDFTLNGFISYQKDYTAKDNYPADLDSDNNYMFNGSVSQNKSGVRLTDANFASLTPPQSFERDEHGRMILGDFLRFIPPQPSGDGGGPGTDPGDGPGSGSGGEAGSGSDEDGRDSLKPDVAVENGIAKGTVDAEHLEQAFANAQEGPRGRKQVFIELSAAEGAAVYELSLPVGAVAAENDRELVVSTPAVRVVLPGDMMSNAALGEAKQITLHAGLVSVDGLAEELAEAIGDRPIVEFRLTIDGRPVPYNNPEAPVVVSVPYTPTEEELAEPEHITVWYIDEEGAVVPVTSGKYDTETGMVTFKVVHFSKYAVVFVKRSFADLAGVPWAQKQIEVLASKGIIRGVSDEYFAPDRPLTRADFIVLLVRTFGLASAYADVSFTDVHEADYYYEAVGIAQRLGIAQGRTDGKFYPKEAISRQDMFVLAVRAMKAANLWRDSAGVDELSRFGDSADVADYAAEDLSALVKHGMVRGSDGYLRPHDRSTRAEAAVFLYSLYQAANE